MITKKVALFSRHEFPEDVIESIFGSSVSDVMDFRAMEATASRRLVEMFPESYTVYGCHRAQADYTDVAWNFRGQLDLYATGLTMATLAVVNACIRLGIKVNVMHFDRTTSSWRPQPMCSAF